MKILCPIDFSHHSKIAAQFALRIAELLDANLYILTVVNANDDEKERNKYRLQQEEFITGVMPLISSDIVVSAEVKLGSPGKMILDYSEQMEADLIIMGTQGINSIKNILIGSVSEEVALKTRIPLIAIPEMNIQNINEGQIILTLDNQVIQDETLFKIPKLIAKKLATKIDLLHVITKEEDDLPFDPFVYTFLEDYVGETELIRGENILRSINKYIENKGIDMVLMIRRQKGFFKDLFSIHNSLEQIIISKIPVMILPEKN